MSRFTEEAYREMVADQAMQLQEYKGAIEILGRQNAEKDLEIARLRKELGAESADDPVPLNRAARRARAKRSPAEVAADQALAGEG